MKKRIGLAIAIIAMLVVLAAMAFAMTETGVFNPGAASTAATVPVVSDFTTTYHFGDGSSRNAALPGYEYQFEGDTVHFWTKLSDNSIALLEGMAVKVRIYCNAENDFEQPLTFIGPVYGTGPYYANYEADYIIPEYSGNCRLSVIATNPLGGTKTDTLLETKYLPFNDLLMNPAITISGASPSFSSMQGNTWNRATVYPIVYRISSGKDRENNGVIGDVDFVMTEFQGIHSLTDYIPYSDIRWKLDSGAFKLLTMGPSPHTGAGEIGNGISTDTDAVANVYFELWYAANHPDYAYSGGAVTVYYTIY